jgi:LysM repeat protein
MNPPTLPIKRRPVSKGFFKRLNAVTRHRNQRVATTATAEDVEERDHSRGFVIIVLIHILAIILYFVHLNFLNDHSPEQSAKPATKAPALAPKPRVESPPIISPGDAACMVAAGDNYTRIAAREGVDESALRAANNNATIRAGMTLIRPPKRIVATDPPEVVTIRSQKPSLADRGLVESTELETSPTPPRAVLVRPNIVRDTKPAKATAVTKGRSYVVQPGDNVLRIAKRFKIDSSALMRANSISDPRKLKTGMTLAIPTPH